ncbi:MAG: tetratricopeptide repeat protein [Rhodospirillaceae bacterium]|nr:tetratricopeptide repeat protein [Rhodospirillaceae bacterium]
MTDAQQQRVAEFIAELEKIPEGAHFVDFLMSRLPEDERRFVDFCAIPHQFSLEGAKFVLADWDRERVERVFKRVLELAIVTPSATDCALHDEARNHLFRKWLEPDRQAEFAAVNRRIVDFLALQRRGLGPTDFARGDALLTNEIFHSFAYDRAGAMDKFYHTFGERRAQGRYALCETLVTVLLEYDPILTPRERLVLTYSRGKVEFDLDDDESAAALFQEVAASDQASVRLKTAALSRLGQVRLRRHELDAARAAFEAAINQPANDPNAQKHRQRALIGLGNTFGLLGNFDQAKQVIHRAIELAETRRNLQELAAAYTSLGRLYQSWGYWTQAEKYLTWTLELLKTETDTVARAQALANLGSLFVHFAHWAKAEPVLNQAYELFDRLGHIRGKSIVQQNLFRVMMATDKPEALDHGIHSFQNFVLMRDFFHAGVAGRGLARYFSRRNNPKERRKYVELAIEAFTRAKARQEAEALKSELGTIKFG